MQSIENNGSNQNSLTIDLKDMGLIQLEKHREKIIAEAGQAFASGDIAQYEALRVVVGNIDKEMAVKKAEIDELLKQLPRGGLVPLPEYYTQALPTEITRYREMMEKAKQQFFKGCAALAEYLRIKR